MDDLYCRLGRWRWSLLWPGQGCWRHGWQKLGHSFHICDGGILNVHVSEKVDINLGPSGFAMIIGSCAKPHVYTRAPAAAMPGPEARLYPRANTSPGGLSRNRAASATHLSHAPKRVLCVI